MTAVSEMSEEDLELERRRIREEHDRAWTEYRRALSLTLHMHRFVHDGEMKDMLEKLDHARGLRRREKEIEEELKRRRGKG